MFRFSNTMYQHLIGACIDPPGSGKQLITGVQQSNATNLLLTLQTPAGARTTTLFPIGSKCIDVETGDQVSLEDLARSRARDAADDGPLVPESHALTELLHGRMKDIRGAPLHVIRASWNRRPKQWHRMTHAIYRAYRGRIAGLRLVKYRSGVEVVVSNARPTVKSPCDVLLPLAANSLEPPTLNRDRMAAMLMGKLPPSQSSVHRAVTSDLGDMFDAMRISDFLGKEPPGAYREARVAEFNRLEEDRERDFLIAKYYDSSRRSELAREWICYILQFAYEACAPALKPGDDIPPDRADVVKAAHAVFAQLKACVPYPVTNRARGFFQSPDMCVVVDVVPVEGAAAANFKIAKLEDNRLTTQSYHTSFASGSEFDEHDMQHFNADYHTRSIIRDRFQPLPLLPAGHFLTAVALGPTYWPDALTMNPLIAFLTENIQQSTPRKNARLMRELYNHFKSISANPPAPKAHPVTASLLDIQHREAWLRELIDNARVKALGRALPVQEEKQPPLAAGQLMGPPRPEPQLRPPPFAVGQLMGPPRPAPQPAVQPVRPQQQLMAVPALRPVAPQPVRPQPVAPPQPAPRSEAESLRLALLTSLKDRVDTKLHAIYKGYVKAGISRNIVDSEGKTVSVEKKDVREKLEAAKILIHQAMYDPSLQVSRVETEVNEAIRMLEDLKTSIRNIAESKLADGSGPVRRASHRGRDVTYKYAKMKNYDNPTERQRTLMMWHTQLLALNRLLQKRANYSYEVDVTGTYVSTRDFASRISQMCRRLVDAADAEEPSLQSLKPEVMSIHDDAASFLEAYRRFFRNQNTRLASEALEPRPEGPRPGPVVNQAGEPDIGEVDEEAAEVLTNMGAHDDE